MRGRGFIGLDNLGGSAASRVAAATSLGYTGGAETADLSHTHTTGDVTLTAAQSGLPSHSHTIYLTDNGGGPKNTVLGGVSANITTTATADAGGSAASQAHNHGSTGNGGSTTQAIMNPYIAISYIIKY
jgi:microcystin-dependent protein